MSAAAGPALALLLGRRSVHALAPPAPSAADLELIFRAALRVPDFQRLRPFHFFVAEGDGLDRLGAMLARAAVASGQDGATVKRAAVMPRRAPLVIAVAATPRPSDLVPPFEQELCAGCAVLAMLLAARALGFGGVWRTGWAARVAAMARELGLGPADRIVGFLYLGTPVREPPAPDDEPPARFVTRL